MSQRGLTILRGQRRLGFGQPKSFEDSVNMHCLLGGQLQLLHEFLVEQWLGTATFHATLKDLPFRGLVVTDLHKRLINVCQCRVQRPRYLLKIITLSQPDTERQVPLF